MISIIHKSVQKPVNLFRFECGSCGCVWVTDEVRLAEKENYCITVADCPECGVKDIPSYGFFGRECDLAT